ncbi:MAG TPA: AraC family transcriptional regulator [Candidatus Acidoferrales bacterium]|nr:AraC family transcriptional regulator [Candidatus Acidoferrales bacterium]
MLGSHVPFTESFIVVSLPRGGLQIAQPAKVSESLLQNYAREFHQEDRPTWRVIQRNHAMTGQDLWGTNGGHEGRFVSEFMEPAGLKHLAVAPLTAPIFDGYAGAWHVYRNEQQGPFSAGEVQSLAKAARQFDEESEKLRASRQSRSGPPSPWGHHPSVKQFIFDSHLKQQLPEAPFQELDEKLQENLLRHARQRLAHAGDEPVSSVREMIADSRGDLWIYRSVVHPHYPALGSGPFIFYCLQPDARDWAAVRSTDFPADSELSRLAPAIQFMHEEFRRSPRLTEIAETVGLSAFHFHRRFTEVFGITPKHLLLECQIYAAKNDLLSGEKSLVDIASSCGFAHQSHFTSRFKQVTGFTPTRWRRVFSGAPEQQQVEQPR